MAQGGNAKVAPFPVQLRQSPPSFSEAALAELRAEFVKVLRESGTPVPATFEINNAITMSKREDCDVEDACLAALALRSDSLYALYVVVEWNLKDAVTASGRVVRTDNQLSVPKKSVTVSYSKKEGFAAAAKQAIKRLVLEELKLTSLPTARPGVVAAETPPVLPPADAGVTVMPPAPADAGVVLPPPPLPPLDTGPSGGKIAGYVMAGAGGLAAIAGGVVFGGGLGDAAAQLDSQNRLLPAGSAERAKSAFTQQQVGLGVMAGGVAVAAGGLVLLLLSPDKPTTSTFFVPIPGGAAFGLTGVLP